MEKFLYPYKLSPVLKDAIWGGRTLITEYNKGSPDNLRIAESWELAVHQSGKNIILNGELKEKTLEEVFFENKKIVSENYNEEKFPLLIKYIDAMGDLSVQVHPDNDYALKYENQFGKTEMWYIIDAEIDAKIVYGFNNDFSREELSRKIDEINFKSCLNYVNVKKGDVYFIHSGLVHAIGKGILIAEIQQNSDITYRLYDYDRVDGEGNKRELHVKKGLDVCIKTKTVYNKCGGNPIKKYDCTVQLLSECEYFKVKKYVLNGTITLSAGLDSFNSLMFLNGSAVIVFDGAEYKVQKGDSYFIPSDCGSYDIQGSCEFILSRI